MAGLYPVFQVGDFLFTGGDGVCIMDGDIRLPGHPGMLSGKTQDAVYPQSDRQIDLALLHAVRRDGAPILPAVSGVYHDGDRCAVSDSKDWAGTGACMPRP